jgi:hypothetical protein
MSRHQKLSVLARMMVLASAALALLASYGWFGAHGQVPKMGDRQPRGADVPKELPPEKVAGRDRLRARAQQHLPGLFAGHPRAQRSPVQPRAHVPGEGRH